VSVENAKWHNYKNTRPATAKCPRQICHVVTGRAFDSPKCDKCVWRPGSTRSRWESFSAPPDSLATIGRGVLLLRGRKREGEEEERGGKGIAKGGMERRKEREEKGGMDREGG